MEAEANVLLTHFTSSAIVVWAMQRLKTAKWFPFVQHERAVLNRAFSMIVAFAISVGISYTWDPTKRSLLIQIPTLWGFLLGIWHWLNQYAMQETLYQATNKPPTNGDQAGMVKAETVVLTTKAPGA